MSDLANDAMAKPTSDDMSMDEILASIRKIIAIDEEQTTPDEPHIHLSEKYNKTDIAKEDNKKNAPVINGSVRDQFSAINKTSNTSFYDQEDYSKKRAVYQKIVPEKNISMHGDALPSSSKQNEQEDTVNHDDEILQALNEIRESLSTHQAHSKADLPNQNTDKQKVLKADHNITIDTIETVNNIDLKPVQFAGDDVPKFLKNFRNQQVSERLSQNPVQHNINYDFSSMPKFDEADAAITLTDKVMPTTADKLEEEINQSSQSSTIDGSSELHDEQSLQENMSHLRQGAEEIMRRASERVLGEGDIDALQNSDTPSPMTAMISRVLKPMLQEWMNENLQPIAEEVLRQEFRRGLR